MRNVFVCVALLRAGEAGERRSARNQGESTPPTPISTPTPTPNHLPHTGKCFTSRGGAKRDGAADFYLPETLEPRQPERIKACLAYFRFWRLKLNGNPADF